MVKKTIEITFVNFRAGREGVALPDPVHSFMVLGLRKERGSPLVTVVLKFWCKEERRQGEAVFDTSRGRFTAFDNGFTAELSQALEARTGEVDLIVTAGLAARRYYDRPKIPSNPDRA